MIRRRNKETEPSVYTTVKWLKFTLKKSEKTVNHRTKH